MKIKRKNVEYTMLVDAAVAVEVSKYKWSIDSDGYVIRFYFEPGAASRKPNKTALRGKIVLHDFVWFLLKKESIARPVTLYHKNGDTLDNRIENLRKSDVHKQTYNQKTKNKYGIHGIFKSKNKYGARIKIAGTTKYLGYFDTLDEAILVRLEKELELFGEIQQTRNICNIPENIKIMLTNKKC